MQIHFRSSSYWLFFPRLTLKSVERMKWNKNYDGKKTHGLRDDWLTKRRRDQFIPWENNQSLANVSNKFLFELFLYPFLVGVSTFPKDKKSSKEKEIFKIEKKSLELQILHNIYNVCSHFWLCVLFFLIDFILETMHSSHTHIQKHALWGKNFMKTFSWPFLLQFWTVWKWMASNGNAYKSKVQSIHNFFCPNSEWFTNGMTFPQHLALHSIIFFLSIRSLASCYFPCVSPSLSPIHNKNSYRN